MSVNLGRALIEGGHYAEAEKLLKGELAKMDTSNVDAQMAIIPGRIGMGRVLLATHRAKEAVPAIEEAVAMSTKRFGDKHWRTAEAKMVLAECLMATGDFKKAAQPLNDASEVLEKSGKAHPGLAKEAANTKAAFAQTKKINGQ